MKRRGGRAGRGTRTGGVGDAPLSDIEHITSVLTFPETAAAATAARSPNQREFLEWFRYASRVLRDTAAFENNQAARARADTLYTRVSAWRDGSTFTMAEMNEALREYERIRALLGQSSPVLPIKAFLVDWIVDPTIPALPEPVGLGVIPRMVTMTGVLPPGHPMRAMVADMVSMRMSAASPSASRDNDIVRRPPDRDESDVWDRIIGHVVTAMFDALLRWIEDIFSRQPPTLPPPRQPPTGDGGGGSPSPQPPPAQPPKRSGFSTLLFLALGVYAASKVLR